MQVLRGDQRAAQGRLGLGVVLAIAFAILADVLAQGLGVAVHGGALVVGILVGVLLARSTAHRYEASIKSTWSQWMRFAMAAESVAEIHRKVHGRGSRNLPYVYAAILLLAWGLEAGLLLLAIMGQGKTQADLLAIPVIALNGIVAGALAARGAVLAKWFAALRDTVTEMVDNGEIGVWGVM